MADEAPQVTSALRHIFELMTHVGSPPLGLPPSTKEQDSFMLRMSTRAPAGSRSPIPPAANGTRPGRRRLTATLLYSDTGWRGRLGERWHASVIAPDGRLLFYWLGLVSAVTFYNWWTAVVREAFPALQALACWTPLDVLADLVDVLDIVVQFRTGYLEQGLLVRRGRSLASRYAASPAFVADSLALFPAATLAAAVGFGTHPILRLPRLLKTYRVLSFYQKFEMRAVFPNAIRVANLTHILLLGCHWWACFYYLLTGPWVSGGSGSRGDRVDGRIGNLSTTSTYLLSLYWSTLTLTTIGNTSHPKNNAEYFFSILSYLFGVFVFATIDGAKRYMRNHSVPMEMQRRVQRWYDYSWSRGRMTGGSDIHSLSLLPIKLKTELAIQVNLDTLRKVSIFQECQPEFLHDLVLKMCAIIFTPGDVICRKGEIAREMFIIADGVLQVLADDGSIIRTLYSGDFFGEIGILNLDGGINNYGRQRLDICRSRSSRRASSASSLRDSSTSLTLTAASTARLRSAEPAPVTNLLGCRLLQAGHSVLHSSAKADAAAEASQGSRELAAAEERLRLLVPPALHAQLRAEMVRPLRVRRARTRLPFRRGWIAC